MEGWGWSIVTHEDFHEKEGSGHHPGLSSFPLSQEPSLLGCCVGRSGFFKKVQGLVAPLLSIPLFLHKVDLHMPHMSVYVCVHIRRPEDQYHSTPPFHFVHSCKVP